MTRVTCSIDIDAQPEAIFPWLIEPHRLARWLGGFVGSEMLTQGGARLGARSRDTIREGNRTLVLETEISDYQPSRLLEVHIEMPGAVSVDRYELTAERGRTRLDYSSNLRLSGLARLMGPIVGAQLKGKITGDLARLKSEVESDTRKM